MWDEIYCSGCPDFTGCLLKARKDIGEYKQLACQGGSTNKASCMNLLSFAKHKSNDSHENEGNMKILSRKVTSLFRKLDCIAAGVVICAAVAIDISFILEFCAIRDCLNSATSFSQI